MRLYSRLILLAWLAVLPVFCCDAAEHAPAPLTFGITPVFLVDQNDFLNGWKTYLERRLERPVRFVRRKSYSEISDMLLNGQLDAAWICTFPYVINRARLRMAVVPVFRGEVFYRSYLIVSARDWDTGGYEDLRGRVFAFVEPNSNTGYLYPRYELKLLGQDTDVFFRDHFFTWSHPEVVSAVADGLADAGAVDSYIWEVMRQKNPELSGRTRVVSRSTRFGFPPVVGGVFLQDSMLARLRDVLLDMHKDPAGRRLLDLLYLDRFAEPREDIYDNIEEMMEAVLPLSEQP